MNKIIEKNELPKLRKKLTDNKKHIVVAGGCFDMLHPGHLAFLKSAKDVGDILIILLESDQAIQKMKGEGRPIQDQEQRAEALSQLPYTDFILQLVGVLTDREYDELILAIKPAIIATTEGDSSEHHKKRQAELSGAALMHVIKRLPEYSTSKLVEKVKNL